MDIQYSVVEKKINRFVEKYGVGELIRYLEKYDSIINKNDYDIWMTAKITTAKEFNIPPAEFDGAYRKSADPRRIAVYITYSSVKMNMNAMASLLNITLRSVQNYIQYTEFIIKNENVRPDFVFHYKNVLKKFNEWLNDRKI